MKNKILLQRLCFFFIVTFTVFFFNYCNEYPEPNVIYPDSKEYTKGPVITSVDPGGIAVAGVRVITLTGTNFLAGDTTWVTVGNNLSPIIKSMTDTKIEIYRPPNVGTLDIKVLYPYTIDSVAKVSNYYIEAPVDSIQSFTAGSGLPNFFSMEIDKNGTYWTCSARRIDTVSADGLFFGMYKDRFHGLGSAFSNFTDFKFGRGGFLYALVGRADIYRISTAIADSSKSPEVYASLPGDIASKLDFDEQGNIYVGGSSGLYVVTPIPDSTGTVVSTGLYNGITFTEVRVFNNNVYVSDEKNIWRSSITGSGTVGSPELLLNLNNDPNGLDTCDIASFNIDIDGRVYICLLNNSKYNLFVLENDGSVTPFYVDDILPLSVKQILWGYNSKYLYLNRSGINNGIRIYRIGMEKIGAPNYGRNF